MTVIHRIEITFLKNTITFINKNYKHYENPKKTSDQNL